ncbi:unnamed protein product [Arctogadus glacialis]
MPSKHHATPGRVQAPNPLSSVATAPFYFQQPSGSASSAFTGYAPGTCPAIMATAVPALAPAAYSLSQLYQSSFRMRLPLSGSGVSSKGNAVAMHGKHTVLKNPYYIPHRHPFLDPISLVTVTWRQGRALGLSFLRSDLADTRGFFTRSSS